MISLNDVINFLLQLLNSPDRLAAFDADPEGELAKAGLDGLTGQDVLDAQLVMADSGVARADSDNGGGGGGASSARSGGDDPVQAIQHTTRNFTVTEVAASPQNIINIDDRDTIINDSFNSDDDFTVIDAENSFNKSVENDVIAIRDDDTTIINNQVTNDNDTVDVDINAPAGQPQTETPENGDADPQDTAAPNEGIATTDIVEPADDGETDTTDQQSAEPEPEAEPEAEPEPVAEVEVDEPVDEPVDVAAV